MGYRKSRWFQVDDFGLMAISEGEWQAVSETINRSLEQRKELLYWHAAFTLSYPRGRPGSGSDSQSVEGGKSTRESGLSLRSET